MMDKRQQEVLEGFFKELFTWDMANVGFWLVTGLMEFILGVLLLIPVEELDGALKGILFMVSIFGANWYLMAYLQIYDDGKQCKVYDRLKYLPVSLQQIRLFRLRKLVMFSAKMTGVFLAIQLLALIFSREFSWTCIWYPVSFGFLVPVAIVGGITWFAK